MNTLRHKSWPWLLLSSALVLLAAVLWVLNVQSAFADLEALAAFASVPVACMVALRRTVGDVKEMEKIGIGIGIGS